MAKTKKILTNKEIIIKLISISGLKTASELARKLGTERQNLKSYENKQSVDLNNRMISLLIDLIEAEKRTLPFVKS
jgi:DNA-binding CsgD family transcriptional regulator